MATPGHSKAARVYYDHYRVSPWVSSTGVTFTQDAVEITPIEDNYKLFIAGKQDANGLTLNGFLDIADDGFDEQSFADINDGFHLIARCPEGTAHSAIAYETKETSTGQARAFDQAGAVMMNWTGQGTKEFYRGKMITSGEQAVTATGALTGANIGISTTAVDLRLLTVRCTAFSGTTASFSIQGSSDNGSGDAYAAITSFTEDITASGTGVTFNPTTDLIVVTGLGSIRLLTTATMEAWIRLNCTVFTGTSISLMATSGNADA